MSKPLFSVIMPCYNSESYLKDAVDSVLSQTYLDWELVAVNDGSTDKTPEILKYYAEKDGRIKVFSKDNGGYATAVSEGLEKICGKYFLMLGSDDKLRPNLFEEISKKISDFEPDMICFRTVKVKGSEILGFGDKVEKEILETSTSIKEIEEKHKDIYGILFERDTSKCYKTELLGEQRMLGRTGLDADGIFSATFCHKIHSVLFLPVEGYVWTLRDDSVSGRKISIEANTDRLKNWDIFFGFLLRLPQNEICRREYGYFDYVKYTVNEFLPSVKIYDFGRMRLIGRVQRKMTKLSKRAGNKVGFKTVLSERFIVLSQFFTRIKRRLKKTA